MKKSSNFIDMPSVGVALPTILEDRFFIRLNDILQDTGLRSMPIPLKAKNKESALREAFEMAKILTQDTKTLFRRRAFFCSDLHRTLTIEYNGVRLSTTALVQRTIFCDKVEKRDASQGIPQRENLKQAPHAVMPNGEAFLINRGNKVYNRQTFDDLTPK